MLKVSAISIEKLKNNQFQKKLPEFFKLKNVIENNDWHNNDSVFNHTLAVLEELEKLLKTTNNKINTYLNEKVDNYSKKDLLFLATLFHDIAKNDSLIKTDDSTSCPKHEELGSEKVKPILNRFDLSDREKNIVVKIIRYHGEIHIILEPKNNKLNEQYKNFKSKRRDIFIELILLAMADTLGGQQKDNNPKEFNLRINFYKKITR